MLTIPQSFHSQSVERWSCRCLLGLPSYLDWFYLDLHMSIRVGFHDAYRRWTVPVRNSNETCFNRFF